MLDDLNKLIQNYCKGPNHGAVNWREEALSFAQNIQHMAVANLPEKMSSFDVWLFKEGMRGVHENFDRLAGVLDATQSNRTGEIYMHLRQLMAAVHILGTSSVMSPKMKKIFQSEIQAQRGKTGAETNKKKAVARRAPVIECAKDLHTKNPALTHDDLATKILERWDTIDFKGERPQKLTHSYLVKLISKNLNQTANSQAKAG